MYDVHVYICTYRYVHSTYLYVVRYMCTQCVSYESEHDTYMCYIQVVHRTGRGGMNAHAHMLAISRALGLRSTEARGAHTVVSNKRLRVVIPVCTRTHHARSTPTG